MRRQLCPSSSSSQNWSRRFTNLGIVLETNSGSVHWMRGIRDPRPYRIRRADYQTFAGWFRAMGVAIFIARCSAFAEDHLRSRGSGAMYAAFPATDLIPFLAGRLALDRRAGEWLRCWLSCVRRNAILRRG